MSTSQTLTIPYTSREFRSAVEALRSAVSATRGDILSDLTEGSVGGLLIDLAASVIDTVSFGQDIAAQEAFISTCRTYEGAVRFARSVGYAVRGATSAVATLVCDPLPPSVTTSGATLAAGQTIAVGRTSYLLRSSVTVPAGLTSFSLSVVQASAREETFPATSRAFQRVRCNESIVAQGSWRVYVGDASDPANLWSQVDNVLFELSATKTYEATVDAQGRLVITFGSGAAGAVPTLPITVLYDTTEGSLGNLPLLAVTGTLVGTAAGEQAAMVFTNSTGAATGGKDRESLAELKRNVPAYIRTNQRVVTLQDYEDFLLTLPDVDAAYVDVSSASYSTDPARLSSGNVVKCYVWAKENVTFTSESPAGSGGPSSSAPYRRYAQLAPERVATVAASLRGKTMVSVHSRVLRPTVASADIYLDRVVYDPRYDTRELHAAITRAVVSLFETSSGFLIEASEIYNAVRDVPGIRRFTLDRLVFDYKRSGNATGSVTFSGNPANADTLSIDDGVFPRVYEFRTSGTPSGGRVPVVVGANAEATATNLVNAINQTSAVRAYRHPTLPGPTVSLVHTREGESYNIPIAKVSSAFTVAGFAGGTYERTSIREDRRNDQNPVPDPWPVGTYTVGSSEGAGWASGGVPPYLPMTDVAVKAVKSARAYYDETYVFNDEIRYDAGVELTTDIETINLRRLVIRLVPDIRINLR
jgi:hypothetical protein